MFLNGLRLKKLPAGSWSNKLPGTKIRALYQRKKGRDLFNSWRVFLASGYPVYLLIDEYDNFANMVMMGVQSKKINTLL